MRLFGTNKTAKTSLSVDKKKQFRVTGKRDPSSALKLKMPYKEEKHFTCEHSCVSSQIT